MLIGRGTFQGNGGHALQGRFTLKQQGDRILLETSADFFFDGAPEPAWAFYAGTPSSAADPAVVGAAHKTRFGRMPGAIVPVHGKQQAIVPDSIDVQGFDTLFLWCYSVPFILGMGRIEKTAQVAPDD